jgi:hypothetical protein
MIIGISGYAKSGKDTVAKIIQYINRRNTTVEYSLEDAVNDRNYEVILDIESLWRIKKFSGALKKVASLLTGIPVHRFEDQEFKDSFLGKEWHTEVETPLDVVFDDVKFMKMMSVRELLQKLGTDAIRNGLHPNAWVNAAMAGYKSSVVGYDGNGSPVSELPHWIFTDCRFPNEAQAIKDNGGVVIRVDRPGVGPVNDHPSETALDNWDFDYKIANVSDLECLQQTVQLLMNKIWQTN